MMSACLVPLSFVFLIYSCVSSTSVEKLPKLLAPDVMQSTRIIGGEPAKWGEFKGQVSLQNRFRSHVCGGTMIDERHIITAAHCYQSRNIIVYVMGDDLLVSKSGSATRQIRNIVNFVVHPDYDEDTLDSDIAVIRVDAPFRTSANFSAIPRSTQTPKIGQTCHAVGWGTTAYEADMGSIKLLKVKVEVFNTSICNRAESYDGLITSNMFCAGDKRGQRDACQGDSGGLLTCDGKRLTGVISFGYECGLSDYPGVYTDVSKFNKWINETMTKNKLPAYEFAINSTTTQPTTPTPPSSTPSYTGSASIGVASIAIIAASVLGHFLM